MADSDESVMRDQSTASLIFDPWKDLDELYPARKSWYLHDIWDDCGKRIESVTDWVCAVPRCEETRGSTDDIRLDRYLWTWALRHALWWELIRANLLSVHMGHDGNSGTEWGPILWLSSEWLPPERGRARDWHSTENSLVLEGEGDTMVLREYLYECGELWGLTSLPFNEIFYMDLENKHPDNFLEFSYSAEYEVLAERKPELLPWSDLSVGEQTSVIDTLCYKSATNDEALQVADLLACIVFHPNTHTTTLSESKLFTHRAGRLAVRRNLRLPSELRVLAALHDDN